MPVYHCSIKSVSRSSGRSSVAAAAYRAGEKLIDQRTGELFDFTRKGGVLHSEVMLPSGQTVDRETLWNAAELAEKRKDAKVAREFVVALPYELSHDEQKALIRDYAQGLSTRTGWAVDLNMHEPGGQGDQRNVHAHLLCTTRTVELDQDGAPLLGKKTREWDVASSSRDLVSAEREHWASTVNRALERAGLEGRVDHRSYQEQGTGLLPTVHLGVHASAMERQGKPTELGDQNRRVKAYNSQVIDLAKKRQEREEAEAWKVRLTEMETLPLKELEQAVFTLIPESVGSLLREQPEIQNALRQVEDAKEQKDTLQKQLGDVGWDLRKNQVEQDQWREEHPRRAWLHDKGILPDKALSHLGQEAQNLSHAEEALQKEGRQADRALGKAEYVLDREWVRLEPGAQATREKQMGRYQEAKAVLDKRQVQEKSRKKDQGRER